MKPHSHRGFICKPAHVHLYIYPARRYFSVLPENHDFRFLSAKKHSHVIACAGQHRKPAEIAEYNGESRQDSITRRRDVLVTPLIALGACVLKSAVARADEKVPESVATTTAVSPMAKVEEKKEEVINSRIYEASVIGEPLAVGKDKAKVWEKLMNARIVYLGEAEQVPIRDDKELELEIVKNLTKRCLEVERTISLALEAFPFNLQEQLNQYMNKRMDGETLKSFVPHWPPQRWQEYEPLLSYCRDNSVRLVACGTPLEILRTVQAEGIRGLSKAERKRYAPPAGSGFVSGVTSISRRSSMDISSSSQSATFGPSSYLSAQARVIEDYTMSQNILQAVLTGGADGMLVVVTGASHIMYGSRGTGLPTRISKKMQKKKQVVILLDPERQYIRREGEVSVADFLWYSAADPAIEIALIVLKLLE